MLHAFCPRPLCCTAHILPHANSGEACFVLLQMIVKGDLTFYIGPIYSGKIYTIFANQIQHTHNSQLTTYNSSAHQSKFALVYFGYAFKRSLCSSVVCFCETSYFRNPGMSKVFQQSTHQPIKQSTPQPINSSTHQPINL